MNLHPIIVHFPIALLVFYSGLEIFTFFVPKHKEFLTPTKIICLWAGILGSFAALASGEAAQRFVGRSPILRAHEAWAGITHQLYVILGLYYGVKIIIEKNILAKYWQPFLKNYFPIILRFFGNKKIALAVMILSVVGIFFLTIVGALGGAITHGTGTGDPFSDWAVKLFVR